MGRRAVCRQQRPLMQDDGWTIVEVVVVLGLVALLASMAVPVTATASDSRKARHAAGFVASRLRLARQEAVYKTAAVGAVFQQLPSGRWAFQVCVDGNRNGLRRADITSGSDPCVEGPYDLQDLFPGIAIAVDPTLAGPDGSAASANPVRFGSSQIASFSPQGSCTAGTLYVRSPQGVQYAVRVGSATGRTRILRYETGSRRWIDG